MTTDAQTYAGNNHVMGPGIHIALGNPSFVLRHGGKEWLTEWHRYFGPSVLHKRTQDPLKNQPGERSAFWIIAQWWHDQGCKVVDGVGQWSEPEKVMAECAKTGRKVVYWKGYERLGTARRL